MVHEVYENQDSQSVVGFWLRIIVWGECDRSDLYIQTSYGIIT
jgi:hypothetical protein